MRREGYVVVLVDDHAAAGTISGHLLDTRDCNTRVEVFSTRQQMVGIRHRTTRPTLIIDAIQDRSHPDFVDWYANCVLPNAVKADIIKLYKEDE